MKDSTKISAGIGLVILLILVIIFWPFVLLWSINTLIPALSIPYSFTTWLATVIINLSTFGGLNYSIRQLKEKL